MDETRLVSVKYLELLEEGLMHLGLIADKFSRQGLDEGYEEIWQEYIDWEKRLWTFNMAVATKGG